MAITASLGASSPKPLRRCRLPFGGNNPAAIGAGLGAIDPLRVSQLCRELTSWRVSQHRPVVLDYIPGYAFSVPELTLAFNRPNYHTVKLHSLPLSVPYQVIPLHKLLRGGDRRVSPQVFQPSRATPTHTHHLRPVRGRGLLQSRSPILSCPQRVQPAQPDRNGDRPLGYQWKRTDFLRRFPEQGNVDAQLNLGDIYARGDGVPEKLAEDMKWLRFAAGQGHADAQFSLDAIRHR